MHMSLGFNVAIPKLNVVICTITRRIATVRTKTRCV